jgi:hypothetical protein
MKTRNFFHVFSHPHKQLILSLVAFLSSVGVLEIRSEHSVRDFDIQDVFIICQRIVIAHQLQTAWGQVTLGVLPSSIPGLSSTCISVVTQAVACNSTITWAGTKGRFETDQTLNGLCTTACTAALDMAKKS